MVGFYFFMRDLMLPMRTIVLFWSFLSFLRSFLPVQSVKWIFSAIFTSRTNPVFVKEITHQYGFQGEFENKFSLYDVKAFPKSLKQGAFENDFTYSMCSYSMGNCLFLSPLLLLAVRGLYFTLFRMYGKQRILSSVCA